MEEAGRALHSEIFNFVAIAKMILPNFREKTRAGGNIECLRTATGCRQEHFQHMEVLQLHLAYDSIW